jgi:hypothetical protein
MGRRHCPFIVILATLFILTSSASAGGPGQSAAAVLTVPTISGKAIEGQTLSATTGTWSGPSPTYAFQWLRCNTSGALCSAIVGATKNTLVLTAAQVGATIRVTVVATNKNGSAVATSQATPVVTGAATTTTTTATATPLAATTTTSPVVQTGWTYCASENTRCAFTGTLEVSYGANGTFTAPRTFTSGVDCNNSVFGDPLVNVAKWCKTKAAGYITATSSVPICFELLDR